MKNYKSGDKIIYFQPQSSDLSGLIEPRCEVLYYLCPRSQIIPDNTKYDRTIVAVFNYELFKDKPLEFIKNNYNEFLEKEYFRFIDGEELIRPYSKRRERNCKGQIDFLRKHADNYLQWKTTRLFNKSRNIFDSKHFDNIKIFKSFIRIRYFFSFISAKIWYYYHFIFKAFFNILFLDITNLFSKYEDYLTSKIKYEQYKERREKYSDEKKFIGSLDEHSEELVKSFPDLKADYFSLNRNVLAMTVAVISVLIAMATIYFNNFKYNDELKRLNSAVLLLEKKNSDISEKMKILESYLQKLENESK